MRALGLDVGSVRVGLALSDPLGMTAQPLSVLRRTTPERDFAEIKKIIEKHEVDHLILGLPVNMDGSEGEAVKSVRLFAELLSPLNLPVEFVDERLTTVMAEAVLLEADLRRDKRKQVRDKVAAALILQTWLDQRTQPVRA